MDCIFPTVDHSRILLQLGDNDYINASLICMEEAKRNYILTQVISNVTVLLKKYIVKAVMVALCFSLMDKSFSFNGIYIEVVEVAREGLPISNGRGWHYDLLQEVNSMA